MNSANKLDAVKEPDGTKATALTPKRLAFLLACVVITLLIGISVAGGNFGEIGRDSDDKVRLAQITDFLKGQSWFHTDQYRLGLAGGTDMHWSRLPDVPIILLTKIFSLFLGQAAALKLAISIWPPVLGGLLIGSFMVGARHWSTRGGQVFTALLAGLFALVFFRFTPGNIDHHNIQLVLMALSMGCALDPLVRFKSFFISGVALAFSLAIGVDIYIFAAIICGFMALNWMVRGAASAAGTQGFGLGLSAGLAVLFFVTIAPYEYNLIYCDALSLITLLAGVIGGLGLASFAAFGARAQRLKSPQVRLAALVALGFVCAAVIGLQAPQCFANPLDALPEDAVSLWLGGISEAKPLFQVQTKPLATALLALGAPLVALYLLIRDALARPRGEKWGPHFLLIALIIAALALTLYQVRFYPFAYMAALLPLAKWTAKHYEVKKIKSDSLAYIGCLVLSVPIMWTIPALLFGGKADLAEKEAQVEKQSECLSDQVLERLNALPQGLVVANANLAGNMLLKTQHKIMAGNYHRNAQGIVTQIHIAISAPDISYDLLRSSGADYLFYCKNGFETPLYARHNPEGLYAAIEAGDIPAYLERVSPSELEGGSVMIFKVKP